MSAIFTNVTFVILAIFLLGFCVFIHELGHFLAARRRGLKVERFSIGFGPPIVRWSRNGVEYRISWIPFGGYVALPQLADMGRIEGEEEQTEEALPPISYADKMIVSVMGAVFNLLFALLLSCILWFVGREIVVTTQIDTVAAEIITADNSRVPGPAFEAGLQKGDKVLTVDGDPVNNWKDVQYSVATGTGRAADGRPELMIEILRDGQIIPFTIHPVLTTREAARDIGIRPEGGLVIFDVVDGMPAKAAGMLPGDELLTLDGEPLQNSALLRSVLANHKSGPVAFSVLRDGEIVPLSITPQYMPDQEMKLFGFQYGYSPKTEIVHRNPIEQIGGMFDTIKRTLVALFHQGSDVKVRNMSGAVGIVHTLSIISHYGIIHLIWLLTFINVNLAFLNLLPIPVLDGGHMMFATISKLSGRPIPRRFMEVTQGTFMILLLTFMVYVTFFDIGRIGHQLGFGEGNEAVTESTDTQPSVEP